MVIYMHNGVVRPINYAIITVSDSRYNNLIKLNENLKEDFNEDDDKNDEYASLDIYDKSGNYLKKELNATVYAMVPDNKNMLKGIIDHIIDYFDIDCIVITGGTGISKRDNTPEVLHELLDKELDGFKIVLHKISNDEIGYATILSRSTAGIYRDKIIYAIPGSLNACKTAVKIIKDQTGHIIKHLTE